MFHTALAMAGCDDADGGAAEAAAPSPPEDDSDSDDFPEIKAPE